MAIFHAFDSQALSKSYLNELLICKWACFVFIKLRLNSNARLCLRWMPPIIFSEDNEVEQLWSIKQNPFPAGKNGRKYVTKSLALRNPTYFHQRPICTSCCPNFQFELDRRSNSYYADWILSWELAMWRCESHKMAKRCLHMYHISNMFVLDDCSRALNGEWMRIYRKKSRVAVHFIRPPLILTWTCVS